MLECVCLMCKFALFNVSDGLSYLPCFLPSCLNRVQNAKIKFRSSFIYLYLVYLYRINVKNYMSHVHQKRKSIFFKKNNKFKNRDNRCVSYPSFLPIKNSFTCTRAIAYFAFFRFVFLISYH